MALASLKSDLAQIQKNFGSDTTTAGNTAISRRVGVKKDLDTSTLPRTNILDKRGNIPIEYNINNPFQPTINRDISRIQIHWESGVDKNYYAWGLSNVDELGYRHDHHFGFDQPYVIKEIGDRWGFDAMSSWDAGIIRGGASTVVDRVAGDVQRIGKFIFSPKGITYTLKQAALQILNVGGDLGERANIYNPLSPLLNTVPLFHFKLVGAAIQIKEGINETLFNDKPIQRTYQYLKIYNVDPEELNRFVFQANHKDGDHDHCLQILLK